VCEVANEYSGQIALLRRMTYHRHIHSEARTMADSVQQAIKLIEAGRLEQAHSVLLSILKTDPKNDAAWYWMARVVASDELRIECLREAVKINPKNTLAQKALDELEDKQLVAAAAKPIDKWDPIEKDAPKPKTRSAHVRPYSRPDTIPIAIVLFVIALILVAVTYFFTREDLAYRSEGRVMSATVIKLNKVRGSAGAADQCAAEYQFMAYGGLRKGTVPISCAEWDRLDDTRRLQIQYLASQPDRSRVYPPAQTTERYAVMGFGHAVLLIIVGVVLIAWRFWPQKTTQ
jgi:tetratricopeptide (TPR) repeat protein